MLDYARLEQTLIDTLQLTRRPVAVAFRDAAPEGIDRLEGTRPSGCTFWGMAAEGRSFFTVPADHYNCPIGSYTHNMPLPPDREPELAKTLTLMGEIGYLRLEEVPGVPRLSKTPNVTIYAPLAVTTFGIGLIALAAGAILAALAIRRSGVLPAGSGVLFATGFALFLPQFYLPAGARIAHGVLLAAGCLWLAAALWRTPATADFRSDVGGFPAQR